jgi:hypothetical protein
VRRGRLTTNIPTRTFSQGTVSVPRSTQYSNYLFHFDPEPTRLISALQQKGFILNYVVEDFSFLCADNLSTVAFPMLCFCDIPDTGSRLAPHIRKYGQYGIGLTKEWGYAHNIQPVHYLTDNSPFVSDLRTTLKSAFSVERKGLDYDIQNLLDFLISVIAYAKPVWSFSGNESYCFEDECEWRFIPDGISLDKDMPSFIETPGTQELNNYRQALWNSETCLLRFEYCDVERLFIPAGQISRFIDIINDLDASESHKDLLKTKLREVEPNAWIVS